MTKNILKTALVLLAVLSSSCNKWLDLQPQDGITRQEFWKTKEDVKAALNGIYAALVGGGVEERIFFWGEVRADMIDVTQISLEDFKQIRNSNILSTNRVSDWSAMYSVINSCNLLIDFAGEAKKLDPTFSTQAYNSYVGEALTIRAWMYFYLVRAFRDVPLKLTGTYKDSDIKEIGKSPASEVLKQILDDLNRAKSMVPATHAINNPQVNKGRITKYAVFALLSDVYLWNEQYTEVLTAADSVLANPSFQLLDARSGGWMGSVFTQGSSSETIFELSHQTSVSNIFFGILASPSRVFAASEQVTTSIFIPNKEVDANLIDGRQVFFNSSGTIVKYGEESPAFSNFQVYRISDIKLIKAEALNQLDRGAEALLEISDIRQKRGALAATDPKVTAGDKDGINLFILDERAREFAFEGKRWFDLLRTAKRNNYEDMSVLVNLVLTTSDASVQQSALSKIRNPDSHYFPILESELFADTKLVQNPFYLK